MTPRERNKPTQELAKPTALARRSALRLRCTPECIVCVVARVRGEVRAGALARRTPPNWDGDLDSTLGKSFTTRPILSLSLSRGASVRGGKFRGISILEELEEF